MYDELVKRLHKRIALTTAGSPLQDDLKEAADAIGELQKAVMRLEEESGILDELPMYQQPVGWIPVTERLPEAGERVLCYCRANIYEVMKMRTDGDWVHNDKVYDSAYMSGFVTHWMPLPQPPEEE